MNGGSDAMTSPPQMRGRGSPAIRLLALALACVMSGLLLVRPDLVARQSAELEHGILLVMLWAVAGGFVAGVGYVPLHRVWRLAFAPVLMVVLMAGALVWLLRDGF